ncbi:unnamed protein product, partial [Rangifer tarandus platyrhynchus]
MQQVSKWYKEKNTSHFPGFPETNPKPRMDFFFFFSFVRCKPSGLGPAWQRRVPAGAEGRGPGPGRRLQKRRGTFLRRARDNAAVGWEGAESAGPGPLSGRARQPPTGGPTLPTPAPRGAQTPSLRTAEPGPAKPTASSPARTKPGPARRPRAGASPRGSRARGCRRDPRAALPSPPERPATHRDRAGRWALFHRGFGGGSLAAAQTPAPRLPSADRSRLSERKAGGGRRRREQPAGREARAGGCPSAESPPAAAATTARRGSRARRRKGRATMCRGEEAAATRAARTIPLGGGGRGLQEIQTLRQEIGILT